MYYVGLDVHYRSSNVCIVNGNGKVVKQMHVAGPWSHMFRVLDNLKRPLAVCYEASCGYGALHDGLREVAKRVVVAHPGQLRLIFKSKRKNDRVDAKKLATLLFLDQVPQVYVPSVGVRSWRNFIEFRHRVVAKRTRVKNGLRSLLRGHGITQPPGKGLWTRKGKAWLAKLELPCDEAALQRDLLLEELAFLDAQVKRVEKKLNAVGNEHPGVILLRTIPGVGPRTAEAVVAYIDDAGRFSQNKKIGAYFGLVPCQDQSAGADRLGHITREGPATVRKLLVEASWQGIRRSEQIRDYFERVGRGDPKRRKIALVATAHYLIRVMHAMLSTGEAWRWDPQPRQAA
ncbi:MAG: IS110 family RNA-guided transposase [Planctomycetota bacterium]|jgi:transposase